MRFQMNNSHPAPLHSEPWASQSARCCPSCSKRHPLASVFPLHQGWVLALFPSTNICVYYLPLPGMCVTLAKLCIYRGLYLMVHLLRYTRCELFEFSCFLLNLGKHPDGSLLPVCIFIKNFAIGAYKNSIQ